MDLARTSFLRMFWVAGLFLGILSPLPLPCVLSLRPSLVRGDEPIPGTPDFFLQPPSALMKEAGAVFDIILPTPVEGEGVAVPDAFREVYPPTDHVYRHLEGGAVLILPRALHDAQAHVPPGTAMRVVGEWRPSDLFEPSVFALVAWGYAPVRVPAPLPASPYPDGYAATLDPDSPVAASPVGGFVRLETSLVRQGVIPSAEAAAFGFGDGTWYRLQGRPSPVPLVYSDHTQGLAGAVGAHIGRDPVQVYGRLVTLVHPENPPRTVLLVDGVLPGSAPERPALESHPRRENNTIRELIALTTIQNMEIEYVYRGQEPASAELLSRFRDLRGGHVRLEGPETNFLGDRIDLLVPAASRTLLAELALAQPGDTLLLRCRRIEGTDLRYVLLVEDVQRVPVTHVRSR